MVKKKQIKAVAPYIHPEFLNFKYSAYEAWIKSGGQIANPHYPWRAFHGPVFRHQIPQLWKNKQEARLMFVEPVSIYFDTWPYYATHEIIPLIWDCWPKYFDKMVAWIKTHEVRTAIFTSLQEMEEIKHRLPYLQVIHCPEAVDVSLYYKGKLLKDRKIDVLEFGRGNDNIFQTSGLLELGIKHIRTKNGGKSLFNNEELHHAMQNSKMTICFPKSLTHPEEAKGIETLTQRYWEAMLSRMVIVGHAPQELVELIGYNPCIELDLTNYKNAQEQISYILEHITDYQEIVDRNRDTALKYGDWSTRMKNLQQELLKLLPYDITRSDTIN